MKVSLNFQHDMYWSVRLYCKDAILWSITRITILAVLHFGLRWTHTGIAQQVPDFLPNCIWCLQVGWPWSTSSFPTIVAIPCHDFSSTVSLYHAKHAKLGNVSGKFTGIVWSPCQQMFDFFLKFAACSCRYLYQRCFSTVNSYLKIAPWGLLLTSQCSLDISSTECRATFLHGVCRRWDCRSFLPCVWAEAWGCNFFGHWNRNLVRSVDE